MSAATRRITQTKQLALDTLTTLPGNPRRGDVSAIRESLEQSGQYRALVVRAGSLEVLAGNHTLMAMRELGWERALCHLVDVDDEQARRIVLADNRTNDLAGYDERLLADLLAQMDGDLAGTGWDQGAVDELLAGLDGDDDAGADTEPSEPPADPRTKPGDLWLLGDEHRVLCGDATKREDVARLMDGARAALTFTSPPYFDLRDYGGGDLGPDHIASFLPLWSEYADLLAVNLGLVTRDGEIVAYWDTFIAAARAGGLKLLAWNVWNREEATSMAAQRMMFPIWHEWVFVFGEGPRKPNRTLRTKHGGETTARGQRNANGSIQPPRIYAVADRKPMGTVLTSPCHKGPTEGDHPAVFPITLPSAYIEAVTAPGDAVADPFAGSGSTLIACENLHRRAYLCEIDARYVDVIVDRWERHTGQTAVLHGTE
jgi:DNA modification methylase